MKILELKTTISTVWGAPFPSLRPTKDCDRGIRDAMYKAGFKPGEKVFLIDEDAYNAISSILLKNKK